MAERIHTEEHRVSGERLVARLKELVREGNIRRVSIKNDDGRTVLEFPLNVGVVGAVLMPMFVAVGAIAALAADYTIQVERVDTDSSAPSPPAGQVQPGA